MTGIVQTKSFSGKWVARIYLVNTLRFVTVDKAGWSLKIPFPKRGG